MLTVEFIGICTHVMPGDDWQQPHRVVLPRAAHHHMPHAGFLIIPKTATSQDVRAFAAAVHPGLTYGETDDAYQLSLGGVELWVENANDTYSRNGLFRCGIFSVRDHAHGQPLGAPDPDVVSNRLERLAHAYFDIPSGTLSARLVHKSSAAVLNVATDGAPRLRAKSFRNGFEATLVLDGGMAGVPLPPIQLTHTTDETDDSHFVMHFAVASNDVTDPGWPTEPASCLGPSGPPIAGVGLGPGCSNSTFP